MLDRLKRSRPWPRHLSDAANPGAPRHAPRRDPARKAACRSRDGAFRTAGLEEPRVAAEKTALKRKREGLFFRRQAPHRKVRDPVPRRSS